MDAGDTDSGAPDTDLADVRNVPLPVLIGSDDTALTHCLRRLLAGADRTAQSYAAFGNVSGP